MKPTRPCTCDRFLPGLAYVAGRDCRKCWLFAHRPVVRKAWGGDPADCFALPETKGRAVVRRVYEPAHRQPTAGTIRHLLYFVYPVAADGGRVWRWNLDKLRRRINLFNGRRVVAVAAGPGAEPAAAREALAGCGVEFLEVENDPDLREMAAFPMLLESVSAHDGPCHATFYGHAKGVTSEAWSPAVRRWTEAMYAGCLDHWPAVRRLLVNHPVVGAFRRNNFGWPESRSAWHYSGTFRWQRNADLYSRDWREIDRFWCGSESHPSLHFTAGEAACLFGEFSGNGLGLYRPETWDSWATAVVERWREDHLSDRWPPLLLTCILTSHRKRRYVHEAIQSVRAQTSGDWQLVVIDSGDLIRAGEFDRYRADPRVLIVPSDEVAAMPTRTNSQAWKINECFRRGLVRGDLVCYLSDDDVYDSGIFEAWLTAARVHPDQAAWYGPADRCEVRAAGEVKVGELPTAGPTRRLDCVVDGMQICHRKCVTVPWPEDPALAAHCDGVFMDGIGRNAVIHPVAAKVGRHRHTALSTFTRPASVNGVARLGPAP